WRAAGPEAMAETRLLTDAGQVLVTRTPPLGVADAPDAPMAVRAGDTVWVSDGGRSVRLRRLSRRDALRRRLAEREAQQGAGNPECRTPMPGAVVAIHVDSGAVVRRGDRLISVEAMKMEHPVLAPHDGTVEVLVVLGDQLRTDQVVARVRANEATTKEES